MSDTLRSIIQAITADASYEQADMKQAFTEIMSGEVSPTQIAAFLIALKMRGETPSDIAAGASILRDMAAKISAPEKAMDIVGTGGDGIGTYNISTATAFVVAGCGVTVAKHGNRAVSSKSGAADVLTSLGVNLDCDFAYLEQALKEANVCFLMAPRHHAAMRHVGPVRAELGTRTIFNLLGPLSNPALVDRIMVGVYDRQWLEPFAHALHELGTKHAFIVHGADGLDEITTTAHSYITSLNNGEIKSFELNPEDYGIPLVSLDELKGGTGEENAASLRAILEQSDSASPAYRDVVLLNAACALVAGGHETDIATALDRARTSIETGAALKSLDKLVQVTNQ